MLLYTGIVPPQKFSGKISVQTWEHSLLPTINEVAL